MRWLILLAACGGEPEVEQTPHPTAVEPEPPTMLTGLALDARAACGDPYATDEIAFTFVVERDGAEVVRRRHVWKPRTGDVTVSLPDGDVALKLRAAMPEGPDDPAWADLAPGVDGARAWTAWGAFVNDQFWLIAPCKLDDGGAQVTFRGDQVTVTYEGVGVTPGDRYTFAVDPYTGRVHAWQYELASGRTGTFEWYDWLETEHLTVSRRRVGADGTVIRFEDVSIR